MKKLIMLSFAALGIVLLSGCSQLTQSVKNEQQSTSPTSPKVSTSQVYQNQNFGFEFEYPKDFCLLEGETAGSYYVEIYSDCPQSLEVRGEVGMQNFGANFATLIIEKDSRSLKEEIDRLRDYPSKKIDSIDINGIAGYYIHENFSGDDGIPVGRDDFWEFENDGNHFTFTDNKDIVDKILPSFKFIK